MQNGIRAAGITGWPKAIQIFLQIYPTPYVILDVVAALQKVRKLPTEEESEYAGRLSTAF